MLYKDEGWTTFLYKNYSLSVPAQLNVGIIHTRTHIQSKRVILPLTGYK